MPVSRETIQHSDLVLHESETTGLILQFLAVFPLGAALAGSISCFSLESQQSSFSPLTNGSYILPGVPPDPNTMCYHRRCIFFSPLTLYNLYG